MKVNGKNYKTVWMNNDSNSVFMIDQNKIPYSFEIKECKNYLETCVAIEDMTIRGAGAIGACAGYAMAQAKYEIIDLNEERYENLKDAKLRIAKTRPTAQNLFYAIERVYEKCMMDQNDKTNDDSKIEAEIIANEDIESCKKIGNFGTDIIEKIIKNKGQGNKINILTHCNAGWLAFVDHGTALGCIYSARDRGIEVFCYVDETRPRGQGARLTAWELYNENIEHKILADNCAAYYMDKGGIDMMIVGADRISINGDVANKIGTLEKAIVAKRFNVPFYVAAPTSTIDFHCLSGNDIPIEERSEDEVLYQRGLNRKTNMIDEIRIASPGSHALNPGFDVTPAELITGIITEKGLIRPSYKNMKKIYLSL